MACFSLIMEHQFCLSHFFVKLFIKALLSRLLDTSAIEIHYYYYIAAAYTQSSCQLETSATPSRHVTYNHDLATSPELQYNIDAN